MGLMTGANRRRSNGFLYAIPLQIVAALVLLSAPAWLYFLLFPGYGSSTPWDWVTILLLMFVAFGVAGFVSRGDRFLRRVMVVGLLCKFVACAASLYLAFYVYNGSADALSYATAGRIIATRFLSSGEWTVLHPIWSSNFIRMATGNLFIVTGPSLAVGSVVFSLIAFWGQYLSYRAFCNAVSAAPEDRRLAAMLIFLLPSLVFWSASIGKDSLAAFFIGLVCYGYARVNKTGRASLYLLLLAGLAGTLLVRPHVALMLGIALVCPYLLARNRRGVRGVLIRAVGLPLLLGATLYLAVAAQQFLSIEDFAQSSAAINRVSTNNRTGGSAMGGDAGMAARALGAPFLFVRPFPWEIHNAQAALASGEGMLLLLISFRKRRHIMAAVRNWRATPFTVFLIVFLVEFSVIFSAAISNFGLLARERIMATPLLLMLMCVPAADMARARSNDAAADRRHEPLPEAAPAWR
jgi:hypothetical protein